jgi:hypothetical protein
MKKVLLLIPLLITLLACNFDMSTNQASTATPTLYPQIDPSHIPPQATFTFTAEPSNNTQLNATITGKLSYPSEFLPSMRVVSFSLTDGKAYFVDTAKGQSEFSIDVPAGTYYVVSYPYEGIAGNIGQVDSYTLGGGPFAGGYTQMVPCGLAYGCDDHTLLPVTVTEDQTVTVDPGDWYAPEGTFPPMPNP